MEPRTFCDALNREAGDYLLATVLEGAAQGAQLLLCGGVPVWPEHPAACLEAQLPALPAAQILQSTYRPSRPDGLQWCRRCARG